MTEPLKPRLSPRAEFIANQTNVTNHRRIIDSTMFKASEDAAIAEFTRAVVSLAGGHDLNAPGSDQAAAASFHMIQGAYNYIEVFRRLAEPYAKPSTPDKIVGMTDPDQN